MYVNFRKCNSEKRLCQRDGQTHERYNGSVFTDFVRKSKKVDILNQKVYNNWRFKYSEILVLLTSNLCFIRKFYEIL